MSGYGLKIQKIAAGRQEPPDDFAQWSGKARLFWLLEHGRAMIDPEVRALGLQRSTLVRYQQAWLRQKQGTVVEPEEEPVTTTVGSLEPGTLFERNGNVYRLNQIAGEMASVTRMEWSPTGDKRVPRYTEGAPLDEIVTPIE